MQDQLDTNGDGFITRDDMPDPPDMTNSGNRNQQPGGNNGNMRNGGNNSRNPGQPPPDPIAISLDTNKDRKISSDELLNAAVSLMKLDINGDGILKIDELRPQSP